MIKSLRAVVICVTLVTTDRQTDRQLLISYISSASEWWATNLTSSQFIVWHDIKIKTKVEKTKLNNQQKKPEEAVIEQRPAQSVRVFVESIWEMCNKQQSHRTILFVLYLAFVSRNEQPLKIRTIIIIITCIQITSTDVIQSALCSGNT